jgi:hypothetical protein
VQLHVAQRARAAAAAAAAPRCRGHRGVPQRKKREPLKKAPLPDWLRRCGKLLVDTE